MNNNLNRHRLLKILSEQYIKSNVGDEPLGVSWEEIETKMNCTRSQLMEISATLFDEEEVDAHNAFGIEGLYAKVKGASSYTTKKYKRENDKLLFEQTKNWIQILIPVLSLSITLYVVINSERRIDNKNTEINQFDSRLKGIEKSIHDINDKLVPTKDSVRLDKLKK